MFDRCDAGTSVVIGAALEESRRLGHGYLGTEHLLVALVEHRDLLPAGAAALLPDDPEVIRSTLSSILGQAPPCDAELLQVVGVDLDEVREAVRQAFGAEALDRLGRRRVHQPWQPWRRPSRRCTSLLAGTMGVAPRVKQALERAGDDADRRQRPAIDPAALLIGMTEVENSMSNRLLHELGVECEHLREALRTSIT